VRRVQGWECFFCALAARVWSASGQWRICLPAPGREGKGVPSKGREHRDAVGRRRPQGAPRLPASRDVARGAIPRATGACDQFKPPIGCECSVLAACGGGRLFRCLVTQWKCHVAACSAREACCHADALNLAEPRSGHSMAVSHQSAPTARDRQKRLMLCSLSMQTFVGADFVGPTRSAEFEL